VHLEALLLNEGKLTGAVSQRQGLNPKKYMSRTAFIGKETLSGSLLENISTVAPPSTIDRISVPLQRQNHNGRKY
jgi:hypothetical protein